MPNQKSGVATLSPRKKLVFFVITISTPVILFILLELGLRLFGYGVDLSVFKRHEIWGQTYYQMNPDVKFRYFGTSQFQPSTDPVYFKVPKAKGVYRIFCLGESTSAGYPYWFNGAFPEYLLTRLKTLFPKRKIEMINLSMTATNSYTALDIVRELGKYQPDMIIYYGGHNEFYGALGVASNLSVGSYRAVTELYLRLIHLRTFQLLRNSIHDIASLFVKQGNNLSRGTEMEQVSHGRLIPYKSPLYKAAYSIFKKNLDELRRYCRSEGIPLIIGTQVSDLRDQPPFVSGNSSGLSEQRRSAFREFFKKGVALQEKNQWDSAAVAFRSAIGEDSLYADAHYRLAQCLDTTGFKLEALRQYTLARNYDELRFRTDSNFNNLIRSMNDNKYCYVADVVETFKDLSPDSLIGHNLIFEHLHPDSRGAFAIAECYADVMRKYGLFASREGWAAADTVSDAVLWRKRRVTDIDERMSRYSIDWLISGWPFRDKQPSLTAVSPTDTLDWIAEEAVAGKVSWTEAHLLAIEFFQKRDDWEEVGRIYRSLLSVAPLDPTLHTDLANIYLRENRYSDAAKVMLRSLEVYPTLQAYRTLGDIMMRQLNPDSALTFYEKMYNFAQSPEEIVRNGMAISYAYAKAGDYQAARLRLMQVLETAPNFQPARNLLEDVNALAGQSALGH